MTTKCPGCGRLVQLSDAPPDRRIQCLQCHAVFDLPTAAAPKKSAGRMAAGAMLLVGALVLGSCCIASGIAGWLGALPQDQPEHEDVLPSKDAEPFVKGDGEEIGQGKKDALDVDRNDAWIEPPRAQPEPPISVAFDETGVFKMQTTLDPNDPDPRTPDRTCRRFQFRARANTAYVLNCARREMSVRVEPASAGPALEPKDVGGARNQLVFLSETGGSHVAFVTGDLAAAVDPFTLTIRQWDEREPLPAHLKFPAPALAVPKVELAQQVKDRMFAGGAFAPDNKSFWTSNHDMTLTLWQHPVIEKKGSYKLKKRLYALAVDGQGRLYAQPGPANTATPTLAQRSVGDLEIYASLNPRGDADEMPRPTGTILLRGLVGRMIAAKDGRSIYFLDVHNGKLGRIDANKGVVSGSVDDLSDGTRAFCLTPDGKKIYCCADTGHIDVIDTATFQLEHTIALNHGRPFEITATDKGLVFLLGQGFAGPGNCALVDLSRGLPEKAFAIPVPCGHHGQYLQLAPEQDAVFIAGDRKITISVLLPRPALQQALARELPLRDFLTPGWMQISPDGRTILHDVGSILSVSR